MKKSPGQANKISRANKSDTGGQFIISYISQGKLAEEAYLSLSSPGEKDKEEQNRAVNTLLKREEGSQHSSVAGGGQSTLYCRGRREVNTLL